MVIMRRGCPGGWPFFWVPFHLNQILMYCPVYGTTFEKWGVCLFLLQSQYCIYLLNSLENEEAVRKGGFFVPDCYHPVTDCIGVYDELKFVYLTAMGSPPLNIKPYQGGEPLFELL